jgi:CBS domain-containing protein
MASRDAEILKGAEHICRANRDPTGSSMRAAIAEFAKVTPDEVKAVPREIRSQTGLQSIMRPLRKITTVPPEMPAVQALELMGRRNTNQLAVVSEGKLEGIFSQGQVLRFPQIYAWLGTR